MAAPAPLELQGERGPGQQKLPDVNQDLVEGEARKSKEAPARTAFLRKREGRLASQRAVWVPPEPRRQVEPRSKRRRAHKLHKIDRSSKLPAAGESVGQGGHDAWKKSDGERVGNSLAQADSPISLQDGSSGNARLAVLSRAGTHKVELALREAAAGSPVPAAYVEATRTLPRLEAGTLALQLVTGKQGAAAAVHGGHGGASQAGSKRPSWDDRFWKAPSSVSSLMVPGVVAGQWLRKSIVDASLGASGSRGSKPPDPETGRSHGASPESSAAVTRMALAASVASRDFARQRRSPEDAHDHGARSAPRGQLSPPPSPPSRTLHMPHSGADGAPQGLPSGRAEVEGKMGGDPRRGWKQGDPLGTQDTSTQRRPDLAAPGLREVAKGSHRSLSAKWYKEKIQTALPARETSTAPQGEAPLVGSTAGELVRSPSEQGLPAAGKEGAPLSALLQRAGGLGAVLAAAAYEVDQEARHFVEAIRRQRGRAAGRGAGGRREQSGRAAEAELRALQAEMAHETALAEGLARLTDSLTQGGLRSGIARLEQHLAEAGTSAAGGDMRSSLRQVAEAQLGTGKVEGEGAARGNTSTASTGMRHGEWAGGVQAGPAGARAGGAVEGQGRGSSAGESSRESRPARGQSMVTERGEGQAGPSAEEGQCAGEGERWPEAAVTALVGPLSARQPAALFLRQLHAVEALEDSLRAKWLTDSSLGHGQDGSMPLEAPGGESLQEPIGSGTELLRTGARGMGEPRPKLGARTGPTSDGSYGSTLSAVAGATVAPSGAASVRHEDPLTDGQCAADPAAAPGVGGAVAGPGLGPLLEVSAEQLLAWCSAAVDDLVDTEFRTPPATPKSTGNARHSPLVRSCAA